MLSTSKSKYELASDCNAKRYLHYDALGTGLERGESKDLALGQGVHGALEWTLRNPDATKEQIREKAIPQIAAALTFIPNPHTRAEQACLGEGLFWVWYLLHFPALKAKYNFIAIEQDLSYQHKDMLVRSRPDFITKDKQTGEISLHDFKTSSSLKDESIEAYKHSLQFVNGTLGAEALFGKVSNYYVHFLVKGGTGFFKNYNGKLTPQAQQYSPLCYGTYQPANPPLSPPSFNWTKAWFTRKPIWDAQLPVGQGQSNIEWVVENQLAELSDNVALVGPYPRQDLLVKQAMNSVYAFESEYKKRVDKLASLPHTWGSEEFQEALDQTIPRTYDCHKYLRKCEYYTLCHKETGWDRPFENGYRARAYREPGSTK